MKHKKHYKSSGTGVVLLCGNKVVAESPTRNSNFSMEPCECGMEVRTIGCSPETDEVQEIKRR